MKILFAIVLMVFQAGAWAAPMETFKFDSSEQEAVFQKLSEDLRCLVCQNQSIADSNADLATDLRKEIYGMLQDGKTEDEIKEFMVDRYGDYVLYEPPFEPMTWLLWFGPVIIFIVGLFYARNFIAQQRSSGPSTELSAEDEQRLKNLQSELNYSDQNKDEDKSDISGDDR